MRLSASDLGEAAEDEHWQRVDARTAVAFVRCAVEESWHARSELTLDPGKCHGYRVIASSRALAYSKVQYTSS